MNIFAKVLVRWKPYFAAFCFHIQGFNKQKFDNFADCFKPTGLPTMNDDLTL